jgi:hypothetical protein
VWENCDCRGFINDALGRCILASLQVTMHKKIHGVRFEKQILDGRARAVGVDRFLPQAHSNEDVGRKLKRMR